MIFHSKSQQNRVGDFGMEGMLEGWELLGFSRLLQARLEREELEEELRELRERFQAAREDRDRARSDPQEMEKLRKVREIREVLSQNSGFHPPDV